MKDKIANIKEMYRIHKERRAKRKERNEHMSHWDTMGARNILIFLKDLFEGVKNAHKEGKRAQIIKSIQEELDKRKELKDKFAFIESKEFKEFAKALGLDSALAADLTKKALKNGGRLTPGIIMSGMLDKEVRSTNRLQKVVDEVGKNVSKVRMR